MSRENVEVVRRAFSEFEQGNFWVPEIFDPSVRVRWLDALPPLETETVGLEGLSRGIKRWVEPFEHVTMRAERIIDAGDDQVLVIGLWRARGKASGVDTEWRYGAVWTLRDGKVTSVISYPDPAHALEAVGLRE